MEPRQERFGRNLSCQLQYSLESSSVSLCLSGMVGRGHSRGFLMSGMVKDRGGSYPAAVEAGRDLDRLRQHPYAPTRSNPYKLPFSWVRKTLPGNPFRASCLRVAV